MDIFNYPPPRLVPRRPLWTDTVPLDINEARFEAWESVTVVSQSLYNPTA